MNRGLMQRNRRLLILVPILLHVAGLAPARGGDVGDARAAIGLAVPLLRRSAGEYATRRPCFSCHHQTLPLLASRAARAVGVLPDPASDAAIAGHTRASLERGLEAYRTGNGQGGAVTTAGYALWTLELAGAKPDELTTAVCEFLLRRDADRDHYRASATRPPTEGSPFTSTAVALRGLQRFATPAQRERLRERLERVRPWAEATAARDNEDRVFRLLTLRAAASAPDTQAAAAEELLARQREDGGWSQLDGMPSDAYATGTALWTLRECGRLAPEDPAYRRGAAFLLKTQLPDGSWRVATRSRPIQEFFETGFPHGKDQFISISATGWAVAALAPTVR